MFWRSPLKVLILYNYDDHMKKRKSTKEWLNENIPVLRKMIRDTEKQRGYTDRSDYLFIVGARKSEHGDIYWRWTTDTEGQGLITFIGE